MSIESVNSKPKLSIITVCFNSVDTIADTIDSVAEQNYPNVEHIVVDGGSTDGTRELISASPSVSHYLFEPDKGIYDAMNKGISLASGEIIGTLNADDFYSSQHILTDIANLFHDPGVDACYADLVYVSQTNTDNIVRYWTSRPFQSGMFRRGWMPAHPTFFCRRSLYERLGKFDLNYSIAADVELLFRFMEKSHINCIYLPKVIIKMRLGGTTNKSFKNIKKQNLEVLAFLDLFYGRVSRFIFFAGKVANRFNQFIRKPDNI
jgi:glycosyltransferase involved in cell wall biosynthesis